LNVFDFHHYIENDFLAVPSRWKGGHGFFFMVVAKDREKNPEFGYLR